MAIFFFFNIQDAKGQTSTVRIPFPNATPTAVLVAGVAAVGALIQPLVNGGLKSAGVAFEVDVPAWGPTALLDSDVQEKMEFNMRAASGFPKKINIPTILESKFVPGTAVADATDTDIQAFKDFLEDGITVSATLIAPTDIHGSDIVAVESMVENWGKRRAK